MDNKKINSKKNDNIKEEEDEINNTKNKEEENNTPTINDSKEEKNNDTLNGKVVKVFTNELVFGKNDRQVNIFGLFKAKKNGSSYVVYADVGDAYNIVYYATAHIKGSSILTLDAKSDIDNDIVKEYIYKVTNKEPLSDFTMLSLNDIETIEIIGNSKIEVKPEVSTLLIELTIPKKKEEESNDKPKEKKNSPLKTLLTLIIMIFVVGAGVYFFINSTVVENGAIDKTITCTISYNHSELDAVVTEEKTFNFNNINELQGIYNVTSYAFNSEDVYLDFVNRGQYFKYNSSEDENDGYSLDDETYTYKYRTKEKIEEDYDKPTDYEEILSYYKQSGYTCEESISS